MTAKEILIDLERMKQLGCDDSYCSEMVIRNIIQRLFELEVWLETLQKSVKFEDDEAAEPYEGT